MINKIKQLFNKKTKSEIKYPNRDKRRSFTQTQKKHIWYKQGGECSCGVGLDLRTVQFDHITRWANEGRTNIDNCQALCPNCHNLKTFNENLNNIEK